MGYSFGAYSVNTLTGGNNELGLSVDKRVDAMMMVESAPLTDELGTGERGRRGLTAGNVASIGIFSLHIAGSDFTNSISGIRSKSFR